MTALLAALAALGWATALALALLLRRRAGLCADVEHELRGAVTAMGLAASRMARAGVTRAYAGLLSVQLDRVRAALSDLERARGNARDGRPGAAPDEAGRLAQVVSNLVANATEHGAGAVDVSWRATGSGARLEIRNRNRPAGLDELAAQRASGRGRGLGIAARAARELGGGLTIESKDEVTTARLDLPPRAA